jgi:hypothetical protein
MRYKVGDKFVLQGVEGTVRLVNAKGCAYLASDTSGDVYNNERILSNVVFAILDSSGVDKHGKKAKAVMKERTATC